jgi:hypothetical protein
MAALWYSFVMFCCRPQLVVVLPAADARAHGHAHGSLRLLAMLLTVTLRGWGQHMLCSARIRIAPAGRTCQKVYTFMCVGLVYVCLWFLGPGITCIGILLLLIPGTVWDPDTTHQAVFFVIGLYVVIGLYRSCVRGTLQRSCGGCISWYVSVFSCCV